jgi:hypothetical protein
LPVSVEVTVGVVVLDEVTVNAPEAGPVPVGSKMRLMEQVALGASDEVQVVPFVAGEANGPVWAIAMLDTVVLPVLVSVNGKAADCEPTVTEAKSCVAGVRVSVSVGTMAVTPVPVSVDETDGKVVELDVIARVPVAGPEAVGTNMRLMVQFEPAVSVVVQLVPPEVA